MLIQAWALGHKKIQQTVRYTELARDRFKNFWRYAICSGILRLLFRARNCSERK
jgi:hypothetical protein